VITHGVAPSLHLEYKRCRIKQYFKEERALRTETTFNDTYDFGIGYLQMLGQHINGCLLEPEQVAHDCGLAAAQLADLCSGQGTDTYRFPASGCLLPECRNG
jgi:hypothetical protein